MATISPNLIVDVSMVIALLALCIMLGGCIIQVRRWRHEVHVTRHHLIMLETLTTMSAELSASMRSGQEMIKRLPAVSNRLLGTDRSSILLVDYPRQMFRKLAVTSSAPMEEPTRIEFPFADVPLMARAIETGQVYCVEDVTLDPKGLNVDVARAVNFRSVVHIPLMADGRGFAVLSLGHFVPMKYSELDKHMMRLWGAHASVIVHNAQLYQQQGELLHELKGVLEQLGQLFAAHSILQQANTEEQALAIVIRFAPELLEVDDCMVELHGDNGQPTIVAATPGRFTQWLGKRLPEMEREVPIPASIDDGPSKHVADAISANWITGGIPGKASMLDGQMAIEAPWVQGEEMVQAFGLERAGGASLGRLILVRRNRGPLSKRKFEFSRLFSTRVGIALESTRLHQRARRDADMQTMLLRELNHRVKNNLFGIVGLLGLNQPPMSATAQTWLDGMINRIRVMGRTHELFIASGGGVPLRQLLDQMRDACMPLAKSDVRLRVELEGSGNCMLTPDRSVSLMIVLFELCTNAMRHGLGDRGGEILVHVECSADHVVTICVSDSGAGCPVESGGSVEASEANAELAKAVPRTAFLTGGAGDEILGENGANGSEIETSNGIDAGNRTAQAGRTADFGGGFWHGGDATRRGGVGLELVRELMSREMRGEFSFGGRPGGGAAATIKFPLLADELEQPAL